MTTAEPATQLRRFVRPMIAMVLIGLGVHLLLPQLAGLRATGDAIAHASWWLVPVLIGLEAVSLAAYGALLHLLLTRDGLAVPSGFVQRATLVGNAVGRALPGGTGTAFAIVLSAFHTRGFDAISTGTVIWGTGMLSSVVLAALLPFAAVVGLTSGHLGTIGLTAVIAAAGLVGLAAIIPIGLRDPDRLAHRVEQLTRTLARGPLKRRIDPARLADGTRQGVQRIVALTRERALLRRAVGFAAANWLLDLLVVVALGMTVGQGTPIAAIPVAYIVAQIVAAVPLTPGGVGIVESAMVGALVASGAPGAAATTTVLGWRLISHWLPIPIGLALLPATLSRAREAPPTR